MNSILITGCNRGLGLGLVKALVNLPKPPQHLFATCRNKEQAKELQDVAAQHSNVHIMEIDLRNFSSYDNLVQQIDEITKDNGLNVLFNNAGISPKSTRINMTNAEDIINTLETNTVVPVMLAKACLPLLKKASKAQASLDLGVQRAAIINMSSMLGSIEQNTTGGLYAYRTSKAALNAATKSLSIDLHPNKILCVALHPGWVRTEMGGSNAPLDIEPTTAEIIDTISKFNAKHNGGFYQHDGKQLPWELQELAAQNSNIHIIEIDLLNFDAYDNLVKQIDDVTQGNGLNVLFNNSGVLIKEQSITGVKSEDMVNTLKVNTVVPVILSMACLPLLEKASKAQQALDMGVQRAAIINMSSLMGSIEDNTSGGYYSYRTSKAALNAATKSLSVDLHSQKILCVALHPGWVRTEMGGSSAPLEVGPTTGEIIDTIMKFDASHNGGFYRYNGEQLPW